MASGYVKDFLNAWCAKHNFSSPVYSIEVAKVKSLKGNRASMHYVLQAKIKQLDEHIGRASGTNIKKTKAAAAMAMCESLFKVGLMTESEILLRELTKPVKRSTSGMTKSNVASMKRRNDLSSNSQKGGATTSKRMRFSSQSPEEPINIKETEEASEVEIVEEVINTKGDSLWEKYKPWLLHSDIWGHYCRNKQTSDIYKKKMEILEKLLARLNETFHFPFYLFPIGSTINGLGSCNSDMDLCLVIYKGEEFTNDSMCYTKKGLHWTKNDLHGLTNVKNLKIIQAKVPIVRFAYVDQSFSLEIDINCNNVVGIRNSHLLHYYVKVDTRFPALSLVIKRWAIKAGINDASKGSLSSYALILMVIHYLQYGLLQTHSYSKPILPNLQDLFPLYFNSKSDVRQLKLDEQLFIPNQEKSVSDGLSLGDLLLGFFNYYANYFDFDRSAISIRLAQVIPKASALCSCANRLIYIEEPFERTNVARAVNAKTMMAKILGAFDSAHKKLKQNSTLKSIGVKAD